MFGEKMIIGQKLISLDNKKRIILPKFSYAEYKDEIVFLLDKNNVVMLYNMNMLLEKINQLEVNSENSKLLNLYNTELERIYDSCISTGFVDKQKRIIIPKEIIDKVSFDGHVYALGNGRHLKLFKDEEHFMSLKKTL